MDKKKRCKKGEVKNPTTELCELIVEDLKKPKKSLRNKKEDIVVDTVGEKKKEKKIYSKKESCSRNRES